MLSSLKNSGGEIIDLVAMMSGQKNEADSVQGIEAALETLSASINGYLADITRSALKFRLFSQDICFSSAQLAEIATGQAEAMNRIHGLASDYGQALRVLSGQFSSLAAELERTTAASSEMAARSRKSEEALAELQRGSAAAAASAAEGKASLNRAERAREDVCHALSAIALFLHRMEQRTKTAEAALLLVGDLGERTRILATNASIEAAHAGAAGKGFAVIAGEIRKLAESAGASTAKVSDVLKQTMADIAEADSIASHSESMAKVLSETGGATYSAFLELEEGARGTQTLLGTFAAIYAEVTQAAERVHTTASGVTHALTGLGNAVDTQKDGYASIRDDVFKVAGTAKEAAGSAGILSQLGTYLRVGGYDMDRSLRAFKVDEEKAALRHKRREKREMLVYNLEAFDTGGSLVAYLGDISPSGVLLYAENPPALGAQLELLIRLPLSTDGDKRLSVRCVPRRVEDDGAIKRVGCSLVDDPVTKKSVHQLIDHLGLSSLKATAEKAEDADEIEELEELVDS